MSRKSDRASMPPGKGTPSPGTAKGAVESGEIEERIERLERRLEESLLGDDGLAAVQDGIDREPSGDALRRAVRRSNVKRGGSKA
ncbi:MAG TPA: hypothetical protein VIZ90_11680 [Rhizobiaceae bacterium]